MNPAHFAWVLDRDQRGVAKKLLGSFTERGTRIELLRLDPGARLLLGEANTRLLLFALSGMGEAAGEAWAQHAAFQIEPGERATLAATAPAELLEIALPILA